MILAEADRNGSATVEAGQSQTARGQRTGKKRLSILSQLDPAASWLPPTSPARPVRGSKHSRISRSQQTPQETENFNRILDSIFEDLNRNTDVRIGASKSDPWANNSMYGARPRSGGFGSKYQPYSVGLPPYLRATRLHERVERDDDEAAILEMDELQEEASMIQTDVELLEWAKRRVFTPKVNEDGTVQFLKAYSRILGYLMRIIRTHYSNPHLALAIFHYAQILSVESYLSGCLAPAYNELIKIRWESFRDLEGVEQAVREMEANVVVWDATTHRTISNIVDEIGKEVISGRGEEIWGSDIYERVHRLESKVQNDLHREEMIFAAKQREARHTLDWRRRSLGGEAEVD